MSKFSCRHLVITSVIAPINYSWPLRSSIMAVMTEDEYQVSLSSDVLLRLAEGHRHQHACSNFLVSVHSVEYTLVLVNIYCVRYAPNMVKAVQNEGYCK